VISAQIVIGKATTLEVQTIQQN